MSRTILRLVVALTCCAAVAGAQVPFEQAARDLASPDRAVRLRAVQLLKAAAYPEAAIPLAACVTDPEDEIQFEAVAAALNIFLAERIVPRKRVALLVEVRNRVGGEATFSEGPFALNGLEVPVELLAALLRASRDQNPRLALEALYAFGALAVDARGVGRRDLLRTAGPELTAILGVPQVELRVAAARAIGRVYERRVNDPAVDEIVGDAVVRAVNDRERDVRLAALDALGAMRYERSVQALTNLYQYYGRNEIGSAAVQALSRIGYASSAPIFEEWLAGRDESRRIVALEGLARLGDPAEGAAIRAALARERSEAVLLAERFSAVLLANGSLEPLFEALGKPRLHDQAMRYLIELAPGRVQAFAGHAKAAAAPLRRDVADALGLSGDLAALPLVQAFVQDADPGVALAARRAAARLNRTR
jgi:HEAT repeat protein